MFCNQRSRPVNIMQALADAPSTHGCTARWRVTLRRRISAASTTVRRRRRRRLRRHHRHSESVKSREDPSRGTQCSERLRPRELYGVRWDTSCAPHRHDFHARAAAILLHPAGAGKFTRFSHGLRSLRPRYDIGDLGHAGHDGSRPFP